MKVIYGIDKIKVNFKRPIVAIGIFDGLHLGHRLLIKKIIRRAKQINGRSIVLTFDPHPVNILRPKRYLPLLISIDHRIKLLRDLGVDVCIIERFSRNFSDLNAEEFIKKVFFKKIRPREIFVGSNFTFGRRARGNIELLKKMGRLYNFKVKEVLPVKIDGEIVSSTSIRRLIQKGYLKKASRFLGRQVSVLGKVMRGKAVGRILGYPTANVYPCGEIVPSTGVYVTKVNFGKKSFESMAFITSRLSYNKKIKTKCSNIEVHIFNFNKEIYSKYIEIEFFKKIRNKIKFSSRAKLKKRIEEDEIAVKRILKTSQKSHQTK